LNLKKLTLGSPHPLLQYSELDLGFRMIGFRLELEPHERARALRMYAKIHKNYTPIDRLYPVRGFRVLSRGARFIVLIVVLF
jgi:hypothetical protein